MCQGPLRFLPYRIACLRGTFIARKFPIRLRTVSTAKRSMDLLVTSPNHSQVSFPRSVALAQLSSPRACSPEVVICYTDLQGIPISHRGLVQCGRHPDNSMPMTGVAKMHPSCRLGVSFKQRVWRQPADAKRSCLARDAADFEL